jgi:osmotically inducible protein OsmC
MPEQKRTANVTWEGGLIDGGGMITNVGSGAISNLGVTWKARAEASEGRTSPEELISAAHASCYSMALSGSLAQNNTPPQKLDVTATTTFTVGEGPPTISNIDLHVKGSVAGIDQAKFAELAADAGQNCPVSRALKASVPINVQAELAS